MKYLKRMNEMNNLSFQEVKETLEKSLKDIDWVQSIYVRDYEVNITLKKVNTDDFFNTSDIKKRIKEDSLNIIKRITDTKFDVIVVDSY